MENFSNCKPKRMNNAVICKAGINLEEVHKDLVTEEFCLLCSCDWIQLSYVYSQQQNYKYYIFFPSEGDFFETLHKLLRWKLYAMMGNLI